MTKSNINLAVYKGLSKKDKTPFTALKITIGEWDTLYFPKSNFEMSYIENVLTGVSSESVEDKVDAQLDDIIVGLEG